MARRKRRRRRNAATMVNPRRRRSRFRRRRLSNPRRARRTFRRRRNPGSVGGFLKAAVPAVIVGGVAGAAEAGFMSGVSEPIRIGGKLALAIGGALLLRKHPMAATMFVASVLSSLGYEAGVRISGGVVAPGPAQATTQLKALVREDPRAMGALVREMRGLGLSVDSRVNLGSNELARSALPAGMRYQGVNLG